MRRVRALLAALAGLAALGVSAPAAAVAASLPALPAGWPARLELGVSDPPGGAARLAGEARWGFRYQYLSGGVNTGGGWATWSAPAGELVAAYVRESAAAGIVPFFTYYMLRQSAPGSWMAEDAGVHANLQDPDTMRAYYADLTLFFQRAAVVPGQPVVLHVDPDLWGYLHRRASGDDAATVPAQVAATGLAELAGLPDTVAGFAQAIVRLRDRWAPNVRLAYHLSVWGTDASMAAELSDEAVDGHADRAARFRASLGARFDLAVSELSDRDAGYYQYVQGNAGAWWDAADYRRMARYVGRFVQATGQRMVLWQIPLGNTRMRAMDNSWGHYQDNRVEWFLDEPARTRLREYADAGVLALLFGPGAPGTTCACDAVGDGVTDPPALGANALASISTDDDGGFFRWKAAEYYQTGPLALAEPPPVPAPPAPPAAAPSPPEPPGTPGGGPAPGKSPGWIVTGSGPGDLPVVRRFTAGGQAAMPEVLAFDPGFRGGVHVAAGAVLGPGGPAIVAGAGGGGAPHVRLFTPDGGAVGPGFLAYDPAVAAGVRVAACDVDGDGHDEIVTAVGPGGGPHVRAWSVAGASGDVRERLGFLAYGAGFTGGVFVACADLDGDGRAEIVTGADAGGGPHVRVFGVEGDAVVERAGTLAFDPGFAGGVRVAAGDLAGDGRGRIVAGAGPGGSPHLRVLALTAGALVETAGFLAYDAGFAGGVHVGTGRVTGAAAAQILTGAGAGGSPHVRVFSGTGIPLGEGFLAGETGVTGGRPVAGVQ